MADLALGLFDGEAGAEAVVINAIANEALAIGSPVIWIDAATGEKMPRVGHPAAATEPVIGVVTGGDNNGIYVDGTLTNDGLAAAAAGEVVRVCIGGRCKVRVNGSGTAVAAGTSRLAFSADGIAVVAVATAYAFAIAGQDATGNTDAIICLIQPTGIQT